MVLGVSGASVKKFKTREEADQFLSVKPQRSNSATLKGETGLHTTAEICDAPQSSVPVAKVDASTSVKEKSVSKLEALLLRYGRDVDATNFRQVYTDGSFLPMKRDVMAVGVYCGPNSEYNISEWMIDQKAKAKSSNNRAELFAVVRALQVLPPSEDVVIHSDSRYVLLGALAKKGHKTHEDLWKLFLRLKKRRTGRTVFRWVRGHAKNEGNVAADRLAGDAAARYADEGVGDVFL